MAASGKGKLSFRALVTIHSLTGVPPEMAMQPQDVTFLVALRLVTHARTVALLDVASSQTPDVAQPFHAKDIAEVNGLKSVSFTKAIRDWLVLVPQENADGKVDVLLDV